MTSPRPPRLRFDRGTLLLEDLPPDLDASRLPEVAWDPRVAAWRAPARALRALLAARGRTIPPPRPAGERVDTGEPLALRPYQQAALDAWRLAGRWGTVVLPTGSGKTRLALAALQACGVPTLCLVPTRVLLHQWLAALEQAGVAPVGALGDGARDIRGVTVATFESAWRWMARIGDRFDLLVVDEAHHFAGGRRDEALEMCTAPLRLGLTATPPTGPTAAGLAHHLGPVVYALGVEDLSGSPWLSAFQHVTLHVDLDPEEKLVYRACMDRFGSVHREFRALAPQGTWADFVGWAGRTDPGRAALAAHREARRLLAFPRAKQAALGQLLLHLRETRHLVFTEDNATALDIARRHLLMPITCDIRRSERDAALAAFRRGTLRGLVSARVLDEGLDVPEAETAVVVGGSHGPRQHVQRVGRLLRPRPGKEAVVYELVVRDTVEERTARRRRRGLAARQPARL